MSMRPTRKIKAEFIGVFLIGAVAGGFVTWGCTDRLASTFLSRAADKPDSIVARLNKKYADDYHLTPDELNRIQPIFKEMAERTYQLRHQFGVDFMASFDEYHEKIAEQLTPEHRAAYEATIADHRKKLAVLLLPDESSPTGGGK
ncbi:MAG TPA: hypothetical protein VGZ93_05400 [Candidatus Methylacidiphilales bacterium]|jgi:uncharacterized membrane protein|nr:hypothetical protein [Candidatus Methylacidiphilales bacterium]